MTTDEAVLALIDALETLDLPYMLVGSLSSNFYGVPHLIVVWFHENKVFACDHNPPRRTARHPSRANAAASDSIGAAKGR